MEEYQVIIVADTNDADYVTSISTINEGRLEDLKEVANAIDEFPKYQFSDGTSMHNHNWPNGEQGSEGELCNMYPQLSEELMDWFSEDIAPTGEYGIHTICSITIQKVSDVQRLL